jgi:hypothetical protein
MVGHRTLWAVTLLSRGLSTATAVIVGWVHMRPDLAVYAPIW